MYSSRNSTTAPLLPISVDEHDNSLHGDELNLPAALQTMKDRTKVFRGLIIFMGIIASASFLAISFESDKNSKEIQFDHVTSNIIENVRSSWKDYETAGLLLQQFCEIRSRKTSRQDFRQIYDSLRAGGLEIEAAHFILNVTHDERQALETESEEFYINDYPHLSYRGFAQFDNENQYPSFRQRSRQPFYYPIHYAEPIEDNVNIIDLDLYSSSKSRRAIELSQETRQPVLTERLLPPVKDESGTDSYLVRLVHPGLSLSPTADIESSSNDRSLSSIIIRATSILSRALRNQLGLGTISVYIYDSTDDTSSQFLAGAHVHDEADETAQKLTFAEDEIEFSQLLDLHASDSLLVHNEQIQIASRLWTVVIVSIPGGAYEPGLFFMSFGATMIFFSFVCLSMWLHSNMLSKVRMYRAQEQAKAEKTIVSSLFPSHVRDRLIQDVQEQNRLTEESTNSSSDRNNAIMSHQLARKPIVDFFPQVTVYFADLCEFTKFSSGKHPTLIFTMLEQIFMSFDEIAHKHNVLKLETVGDSYVAVAGLPGTRQDHAVAMAEFAAECLEKMRQLTRVFEKSFGPEARDMDMRIGLHSGPVTAGILRGDKGRFQLFGDTMNTGSRMESTGQRGNIQISRETYKLLKHAGKGNWLTPREDKVFAKGKGMLQTYWLEIHNMGLVRNGSASSINSASSSSERSLKQKQRLLLNCCLQSSSSHTSTTAGGVDEYRYKTAEQLVKGFSPKKVVAVTRRLSGARIGTATGKIVGLRKQL